MKKIDITPAPIVIKSKKVLLPERKYIAICHVWQFTDAEKRAIRGILEGEVQERNLNDFMFHLEFLCEFKKEMLEQPTGEDVRETREDLLNKFRGILKYLRRMYHGKIRLSRYHTVNQLIDLEPKEWNSPLNMYDIIQPIEEYVKYLEELPEEPKRPGRDPADSDQFISRIAELYSEYIGKPTTYASGNDSRHRKKKPDSGRFFRLVQAVLRILDLPHEDPSRSIRAALKKE
jgi:hypothetical protein